MIHEKYDIHLANHIGEVMPDGQVVTAADASAQSGWLWGWRKRICAKIGVAHAKEMNADETRRFLDAVEAIDDRVRDGRQYPPLATTMLSKAEIASQGYFKPGLEGWLAR